ncbi:MAG: PD40 domain-containing protein, partial [Armatimonadetes bacterium]|nr:PD40 domain-containing protein [Anaerolineae bacterium]
MLFEMATGQRPFHSDTPYGIAVKQVTTPPPMPRSINPRIAVSVEQVILKALRKKPEERYANATEMAEALRIAVERPLDGSAMDTQRPARKPAELSQATQPNPVAWQPPQQQQPIYQQPTQQPVYYPPPAALYPSPTSPNTPPAKLSRPRSKRSTAERSIPWVSIIIGGLLGCGLLTLVVAAVAVATNEFINSANPAAIPSDDAESRLLESGNPIAALSTLRATPELFVTPTPARAAATVGGYSATRGKLIFFAQRAGDEDYEIYRMSLSSESENIQLTSDNRHDMYPATSPDGKRVAFQSDKNADHDEQDFDIYTTNPAGGGLIAITQNTVDDLMPAWSPDGAWLAFASDTRQDGAYDVVLARQDGSEPRIVLSNGQRNSTPRWSIDGSTLLFTTGAPDDASTWDLALLDLASGDMRYLTKNAVRDAWGSFSPDGTHVLYVTGGDGVTGLVRLALAGGEPEYLYAGDAGEYVWGAHYSPDGAFIVFNAGALEDPIGHVYIMQADGSGRRRIMTDGGLFASWLP